MPIKKEYNSEQVPQIFGGKIMEQAKSLDPKVVFGPIIGNRWIQLTAGVVAMIVISNFQYAFTLFHSGTETDICGCALCPNRFSFLPLFILFETWRCRSLDI